jgi:hypothetical protein
MVLRLYDPLTETDTWAFDFLVGSKGWIIADEAVGVLEPTGKFAIIRLADGTRTVEAKIDHQPSLTGIFVLASESTYVLVTNTPVTESPPNMQISPAPGGFFSPLVNGYAYAFDRRTGKSLWPQPVQIDQFGLPLQQSSELPVVVFLRQIRKTERGRSAGIATSVLCLDKRSGQTVYSNDDIPTQTRAFETVGDLPAAKVSLMLPARTINLTFAEERDQEADKDGESGASDDSDKSDKSDNSDGDAQTESASPPADAGGEDNEPDDPADPIEPAENNGRDP